MNIKKTPVPAAEPMPGDPDFWEFQKNKLPKTSATLRK
jgi:hypothetical protein